MTDSSTDERAITDKNNSKKNRSQGKCEVVSPGAWDSIDCGNAICPAEKCSLDHMLAGNNFISFDGSEVKGECIEVRIKNSKLISKCFKRDVALGISIIERSKSECILYESYYMTHSMRLIQYESYCVFH